MRIGYRGVPPGTTVTTHPPRPHTTFPPPVGRACSVGIAVAVAGASLGSTRNVPLIA